MFGFIHLIGPEEYRCHVLCCNPTAIELSQTLQEACVVRIVNFQAWFFMKHLIFIL